MNSNAVLALENGLIFEGTAIGASGLSVGEVVFNTSITGYQEILTDPSYAKQIITLTHPHITDCIHLATSVRHDATRPRQILRSGDLAIARIPGHHHNHSAGGLNH